VNTQGEKKHSIVFEPSGRRGHVSEGKTILEAAQELGVDLQNVCGGQAQCGKCKVMIVEGSLQQYDIASSVHNLSSMEEDEKKFFVGQEQSSGWRLACQARIEGDVAVFVPDESRADKQIIAKEPGKRTIDLKPPVKRYCLELIPADLDDLTAAWERLKAALREKFGLINLKADYNVLRNLPEAIKRGDWKVTASVWMDREVVDLKPGFIGRNCGLALDIGTTTVAAYLCDLNTGEVLATESMVNPQVVYGEDVMSRITYTMVHPGGLKAVNKTIIQGINHIIRDICHQAGISEQEIVDIAWVGNTCMHHLFLNVDPEQLGQSPFVPVVHHSFDVKARDLGLGVSAGAYVYLLPIIAGFVGADTSGVLIAEEPYNRDETVLIIDVGTNGELVLGNRERLICCSCATGPAFEGATIKHGMRAAPGAIEVVRIDPGTMEVKFKVIGDTEWNAEQEEIKAKGICGSGIIDAVAQMLSAGVLEKNGRFVTGLNTPRLRITDDGPVFVVAWEHETASRQDIFICQADVRAIQLAKGAIYAAAQLMMHQLEVKKLDKVILAGAFGSFIDKRSAATIGMLPKCDLEDVQAVGNAAGDGARIALLNIDKRKEANLVAREVEYLELTTSPDFQNEFINAMNFPNMNDTLSDL
jgi:uncharacterized 2Fe-2S/4Fe-4S cluster protein (DUF4445 family)